MQCLLDTSGKRVLVPGAGTCWDPGSIASVSIISCSLCLSLVSFALALSKSKLAGETSYCQKVFRSSIRVFF